MVGGGGIEIRVLETSKIKQGERKGQFLKEKWEDRGIRNCADKRQI